MLRCSRCEEDKPCEAFVRRKDAARGYEYNCKECRKSAAVKYRATGGNLLAARKWKAKNAEYVRAAALARQKANPAKASEARRAYEASKIQATPAWTDRQKTAEFYELMQAWNSIWPDDPVHVDHIIPLKGKQVCGMHVHTNLQILRAVDNMKKHNNVVGL